MRWFVTSIHILVIGCAVSIPVAIFNGTLFSWHPTLMSMAFLGFMAEGVLTSISFRSLVRAQGHSCAFAVVTSDSSELRVESELREGHPCMQNLQVLLLAHTWLPLLSIHSQMQRRMDRTE